MSASSLPQLIRRCLWCKARTGSAGFFDSTGNRIAAPMPELPMRYTDTICPQCKVLEIVKINNQRKETTA